MVIRGPISNIGDEYKQWTEEESLDENHALAKDILSISRTIARGQPALD